MAEKSIRDEVEKLVIKNSRLTLNTVEQGAKLDFDLGYDSHALLNLLLDLEDTFDFEVPPDRVPEYAGISFGDLVRHVAEREERKARDAS